MATLALAAAGAAVGSAALPAGVSVLGTTLSGAAIGAQVGSLAGSFVDQALFGTSGEPRVLEGPRLSEIHLTTSTEGAPVPKVYGRVRVGGQVIWATDFEEEAVSTSQAGAGSSGGKGGFGGGSRGSSATSVEYRYYANFAIALAEGEISGIGRVWANGAEINLSQIPYRVYFGSETQSVDGLIQAHEGADAPAYRGVAYIVFERFALADYGNRLPQFSFEVFRSVEPFGEQVRAVCLIPGSGEFVYSTTPMAEDFGGGQTLSMNVHTRQGGVDWSVALDQLQSSLPSVKNVSMIVSWFGTDLRAGDCEIKPGVDSASKVTTPDVWRVAGVDRSGAHVVSLREGRPAYGGTPSDSSVVEGIKDLRARGIDVTLAPFVLMDIASGNGLADPYGALEQAAYPWRGRITCHPAPGESGSPDKTTGAASQIAAFVGTAAVGDFSISGEDVVYSGPQEWSYRRMVLHQAHLAKAAGGVDTFLIGTELRGLSWVRESAAAYPFVDALVQLAADVKSVLGAGTKVTYAADWSEYFGHQPADGSGDVYFHLDPLWASNNIDAVGIDCYWPLSDWRDGRNHADYDAGVRSIYDLGYLRSNVASGEGYDWFYASTADRDGQVRTPITDGAGKPWVFRYKDVTNWWSNQHFDRPGGTESGSATAWVPQSKPIWLLEIGCPAADKGSNQPNVFVDPKSSESFLPYYSNGSRDDFIQRRYLRALIEAFSPDAEGYVAGTNPVSTVYGGRMLDTERMYVYCWDARPFPAFPYNTDVWGDGENWRLGHWLNGRFTSAPLAELVTSILEDFEFFDHSAGGLSGTVPGYVIDRVMSARDALQPLGLSYFFDSLESGGRIAFRHRGGEGVVASLTESDLVETRADASLLEVTRGQETELPASAKITYLSSSSAYQQSVAEARRLVGASGRVSSANMPVVLEPEQANQIAETWLFETWAGRERAKFVLPPSLLGAEPGDVISVSGSDGAGASLYRITEISDRGARDVQAQRIDPSIYGAAPAPTRQSLDTTPVLVGRPEVTFLDLPLLRGDEVPEDGYVVATQNPWPGAVAVYASPEESGFSLRAVVSSAATMGVTLDALPFGPSSRIDYGTRVRVSVSGGTLASVSRLQLLQGENAAAIAVGGGVWEVLQFESAELVGEGVYELTGFLRGQAGTETRIADAGSPVGAGAVFVVLSSAVTPVSLSADEIRRPYSWRFGPASRDIGDATFGQASHTFVGEGLRPLAPVHIRKEQVSGGVDITWLRRTRSGGDSWELAEVPLGEDNELYEVDVLSGGLVVRTLQASSPRVTYSEAEQLEDFGVLPSQIDVNVYQISSVFGRGSAGGARV